MKFSQWTTPDGSSYFPAGRVTKQLPPGYYIIGQSTSGMYLSHQKIKNESLIRFPDSNSDTVIAEINKFWKLHDRFIAESIQHKRGILLYGPPGSGKTCTLRIVVEDLITKQNGIVVEWAGPSEILECYTLVRQIHPEMPIIVMMEDVDTILSGGSSKSLNLLDGVNELDRVVFLATTNHPEQLGSRVVNRPSRFDKRFFIGMPNDVARSMFLESKGIAGDELKRWVGDTKGFSIAHLKELYIANKIIGDDYEAAVTTIGEMKFVPSSKFFDETKPMSERQFNKYDSYGDGSMYREHRSKVGRGSVMFEGIEGIAARMG